MTLNRPLDDLISPPKAQILAVLQRTNQPLSGQTIAALTGTVSQPTTSRTLIELGRRGLVLEVPGGYQLNRDHLSYRAIETLLDNVDEFEHRVAEDVAARETPPLRSSRQLASSTKPLGSCRGQQLAAADPEAPLGFTVSDLCDGHPDR